MHIISLCLFHLLGGRKNRSNSLREWGEEWGHFPVPPHWQSGQESQMTCHGSSAQGRLVQGWVEPSTDGPSGSCFKIKVIDLILHHELPVLWPELKVASGAHQHSLLLKKNLHNFFLLASIDGRDRVFQQITSARRESNLVIMLPGVWYRK